LITKKNSLTLENRVLWHVDAPKFKNSQLPNKSDIVIIGAGLAGCSLGLELSRLGISSIIIERNFPAWGASGRNAGHMLSGTSEFYNRSVEMMGRDKARDIWAFTVENVRELGEFACSVPLDLAYARTGYLACAQSSQERKELERSVQLLREDGFMSEFWTADQLTKRYGASPFLGARYCPDDAQIHPAKLVWAILREYQNNGGQLVSQTSVNSVESKGEAFAVETDLDQIECSMVVHCTNAWTAELLPVFKDKIVAVRGQMMSSERLHRVFPMAMSANFGYEYWRQAPQGEAVIGGKRWSQQDSEKTIDSDDPDMEIHAGLVKFMQGNFPKLKNAEVLNHWTGQMGFSSDGLPWVGEVPGKQGQFVLAGFTGHGFGLAWKAARCLASEMINGQLSADLKWFRPRR
jgi:gamma-glutamylputrescine oxidase